MNSIVPPSLLFQYFPIIFRNDAVPLRRGAPLQLTTESRIFVPSKLNSTDAALASAFDMRLAWNPAGLGVSIEVTGKQQPVLGDRGDLKNSDHIQLMIDTRHTASVHRATAYCSSFEILPVDSATRQQPSMELREIAQQHESRRKFNPDNCRLWCELKKHGYLLEVWIPARELYGFDEATEIRRLGFYCMVHDTELGVLPLSVADDFPVAFDPSQWLPMELSA